MKTKNERSSLDALESSGRLSQLSRAKKAVALNSVRHVRMCTAYEKDKHVTVYVLDVFLQAEPRGLPTTTEAAVNTHKQSKLECRLGEMSENTEVRAEYQVEHRYSAFRTLRKRISEAVAVSNDSTHPQWCPYCSRARNIVDSHRFPSRFPNRGRVAVITGLHKLLVHSREHRLGVFVNQLLQAAKDVSYRSGCNQCERFEAVSRLLSDFLRPKGTRGDKEERQGEA